MNTFGKMGLLCCLAAVLLAGCGDGDRDVSAVSGAASESSAAPEAVSDDVSENEPSFGEISWDDVSGESSEAVLPESEYSVLKRLEGTVAVVKKETDGVTRIGLLENGEPITDFEYDNYRIVMDSTSRYVVLERSDGAGDIYYDNGEFCAGDAYLVWGRIGDDGFCMLKRRHSEKSLAVGRAEKVVAGNLAVAPELTTDFVYTRSEKLTDGIYALYDGDGLSVIMKENGAALFSGEQAGFETAYMLSERLIALESGGCISVIMNIDGAVLADTETGSGDFVLYKGNFALKNEGSRLKIVNVTGEGGTAEVTTVSDMLVFRTEDGIEILDYAGNITILHEYDGFRSERRVGRALFCVLKDRGGNLRRVAAVDGVIDMNYDFDGNDKKYRAELYDAANAFARAVMDDDADGVKKYGTAELAEAFLKYRDGDAEGNPQGKHIFDFRKFYEGFDGGLSCRNSELTEVVPVFADEEDGYFALAFDIPHTSPPPTYPIRYHSWLSLVRDGDGYRVAELYCGVGRGENDSGYVPSEYEYWFPRHTQY